LIWREKRVLLIILGVLLVANTIFFFTYRVQYQTRLDGLEQRRALAQDQLNQARAAHAAADQRYNSYRKIQSDVQTIYDKQWSTESQRLTALISEVKRLAAASQLVPPSYSFTEVQQKVKGIPGAKTVGITFTVQGNYQQVRRLINLLELSRQFVIIDHIGLSSADSQTLTVNLSLKTLFRDPTAPQAGANQEL
jgi:Tfp pilus assembly protein PilN